MTPNDIDFLMDVKRMRFCQTAYLKSRNRIYLDEARQLEAKVDNRLKALFQENNISGYITLSYDEVMKKMKEDLKNDQLTINI